MKLDHIAIAVPDIAAAMTRYRDGLGLEASTVQELPEHGVKIVFLRLENATIELMEPLGAESPIAAFLERHPQGGIHHFCLGEKAFDARLQEISQHGIRRLGEPKTGAHGNLVVFFHPKDFNGTLIELEQLPT